MMKTHTILKAASDLWEAVMMKTHTILKAASDLWEAVMMKTHTILKTYSTLKGETSLMKAAPVFVWVLMGAFCCFGCHPDPKQATLNEYEEITSDILANYSSYNQAEWEVAWDQYQSVREECEIYLNEFTPEEREGLQVTNRKLNHLFTKNMLKRVEEHTRSALQELQDLAVDLVNDSLE